jgi:hypothetical protein
VPYISLVFREMWDTTLLDAQLRRLSWEPAREDQPDISRAPATPRLKGEMPILTLKN